MLKETPGYNARRGSRVPHCRLMKLLISLAALPFLIYANASGPDPGYSGVPGEGGTCAACHGSGASSVNTKGGSVAINFGGSQTYVPGQVQHWIVTVVDSSARRWGFQTTARKASAVNTAAGSFKATDSNTQALCASTNFRSAQLNTSGTCSSSLPLMYMEQTLSGTRLGTTGSITFQFDWTPPAGDVGPVSVYIAANAANGNNNDDTGDHVYSATYTLTAAAATGNAPVITGVVNGASFTAGIEAGSWVTIQGTNLTSATNCDAVNNPQPGCRTWTGADFANGTPTALDGVSVTMGGKPAFVYYVSPTQINVQAPDFGTGQVAVTVTNSSGSSNSVSVTADNFAPAFFRAGSYAIATHLDGTLVAPAGMFPNSFPAAKGETVVLWGTGFGPVSPTVLPGQTSAQAIGSNVAYAANPPSISIGDVPLTVVAAGLNPSALGLYQISVTVPPAAVSGDQTIVANAGGKSSPASGVLFSVK
jgi:uncharacterized protein (TIGR03437 family)